ncbi:hypothetical protein KP509_14G063200 [Ceratopteris richardii]|nr:hypothetical protein KP509_14G063200 [Ceratopteris richardii]
MRNRSTRQPRGFGFVTYADPSVIDKVIKDTHLIDGRTVEIKRSVPRESMVKGPRTKKIFVGGLPTSVTEGEFKNFFSQFGKVVENQIMLEHGTGRSRGFGFITFDSEQAVDDLLSRGRTLEIGGKQVEIKKAEPKKSTEEHDRGYGPPEEVGSGYRSGDYDSYDGYGFGKFGGLYGGTYGSRSGGYADGPYGAGGGGYGTGALGTYGSGGGYGGYGGGMLSQFDSDSYAGMGYSSFAGGYGGSSLSSAGAYGGSYGPSSSYGSGSAYGRSSSSSRYHPYARNEMRP